ncbi:MAG: SIR2 family protein [Verrucomicrobiota bacterium]|nr:SIR2 family protein [Verrucomicrobiota bacterium]
MSTTDGIATVGLTSGNTAGPVDSEAMAILAREVAKGHCILFVGAGVHYPPPAGSPWEASYPPEARPPLGKQLAKLLADDCDLATTFPNELNNLGNLARIATFHEMKRGRNELVTAVQNAVGRATKSSAAVRALAELDFPLVLTTNYDQLLEHALVKADKNPRKGVYDPAGLEATTDFDDGADDPQRPFVFKIHGDVDAPKSVVITDEDYIQFALRMGDRDALHPVPETFRYQFKRLPTLFIGYSLLDYNLRLLFKTLRWKLDPAQRKPAYSVDLYPDPLLVEQFERRDRYVQFIVQDLWTFIPELYRQVKGREMAL